MKHLAAKACISLILLIANSMFKGRGIAGDRSHWSHPFRAAAGIFTALLPEQKMTALLCAFKSNP
jgi:hypothetical protein